MLFAVDRSSFGDVLRRHLDPVLAPYGFASGQGDGPQVIFCADSEDLAARLPGLPWDRWGAGPGACTDVVVDGDRDDVVRGVRVDGTPVAQLLRSVGREDVAGWLDDVMGTDVEAAAPAAAEALTTLMSVVARRVG